MESGLYPVFTEDSVERIFSMYEEQKKSAPPLYAADGSVIRPDGYNDILHSDEMIEYFEKNVYGKGEYENLPGQPFMTLYDRWIDETYGKTASEKFWDYMGTADGIQDILDVAGIFLEPADLLNAAISLCRGNWEEAAFNLVCVFPLVGDLIGKGGKGLKRVSSAEMETVLKAVKTGEKVLDRLEITYKALSGKTEELKRYLDEGTELFFKIVDDTGESVSYTRRIGNAAADGLDGVRDATRYVDEAVESGSKTGADRAAQYSGSWQSGSVKDAINRFAPDATPTYTDIGKIIFRNETTGIEVVYDRSGNYYRIIDTNLSGKRTALDIDGNIVPNNVQTERGTMRGMTQSEYNAITHFNNTDLDFDK